MPMEDEQLLLRQMPHSVEAEQAVLGSMLIDARCVPEVIDQLRSDDFYVRQNREIYDTIYSMFNYSLTIDPVTVLEHIQQSVSASKAIPLSRQYAFAIIFFSPGLPRT